jgi:hypothetical protein
MIAPRVSVSSSVRYIKSLNRKKLKDKFYFMEKSIYENEEYGHECKFRHIRTPIPDLSGQRSGNMRTPCGCYKFYSSRTIISINLSNIIFKIFSHYLSHRQLGIKGKYICIVNNPIHNGIGNGRICKKIIPLGMGNLGRKNSGSPVVP